MLPMKSYSVGFVAVGRFGTSGRRSGSHVHNCFTGTLENGTIHMNDQLVLADITVHSQFWFRDAQLHHKRVYAEHTQFNAEPRTSR